MKIKICGLKFTENIVEIALLQPDFLGFIFYEKSSRFIGEDLSIDTLQKLPASIQKTGVFVNPSYEYLMQNVEKYQLDYVQLHGSEAPELLEQLKLSSVKIIKALSISNTFDFSVLKAYETHCDYFLFDTETELYGGSGKAFDWDILKNYQLSIPFFLSGGLGLENLTSFKQFCHDKLAGYDFNSKLEISAGLKDLQKTKELIKRIRYEYI